jgi:arylsulfatase A
MNRRDFLGCLAGTAALSQLPGVTALGQGVSQDRRKPNIVLMLVDDLGYGDFGCYGNTFHETPNIDRLAREGMKFTQAYAMAPVCSPSRAGILTGQAPARLQLTQWIPGVKYPRKKLTEPQFLQHLPAGVPTIATELKKQGYWTCSIGKWHLGSTDFLPENFGFDINIAGDQRGHPDGPHGYFGPFNYHNLAGYTEHDNLTELLTQRCDEFLEQSAHKGPFFLYFAEYAVHMPIQERPEYVAKYKQKNHGKDEPDPVYAAMVESVDTALGHLRAKLEQLGMADNTIILLTSDNGGVGFQGRSLHRIGDNGPLHGGKGFLYEGGIREPLIVHWPGVSRRGSVCDVPVWGSDFLPTLLSLAGVSAADHPSICDGLDISPLLRGSGTLARDSFHWHYPHYSDQGGTPTGAIREGDWKLIEFFEDDHVELYNLKLDEGEQYDFASSHSDEAAALRSKLRRWRAEVKAQMPTANPNWDKGLAGQHEGQLGCSATASRHCLED